MKMWRPRSVGDGSHDGKTARSEQTVIVSEFDDHFHLSKRGFFTECRADFNPHHAVSLPRNKAERLGYDPCSECGLHE